MRIDTSPIYLDTSALAKIYVAEPESAALEAALLGRRDVIISDLATTELTSALVRRVRNGDLDARHARRVYRQLRRDVVDGRLQQAPLLASTHRDAERLLFTIGGRVPLRAGDALHLAIATSVHARVLVTFDHRMAAAVRELGTLDLVP